MSTTPEISENGTYYKSSGLKNYDVILNKPDVLERPVSTNRFLFHKTW